MDNTLADRRLVFINAIILILCFALMTFRVSALPRSEQELTLETSALKLSSVANLRYQPI